MLKIDAGKKRAATITKPTTNATVFLPPANRAARQTEVINNKSKKDMNAAVISTGRYTGSLAVKAADIPVVGEKVSENDGYRL